MFEEHLGCLEAIVYPFCFIVYLKIFLFGSIKRLRLTDRSNVHKEEVSVFVRLHEDGVKADVPVRNIVAV